MRVVPFRLRALRYALTAAAIAVTTASVAEDMRMIRPEDMPCNSLCRAWMGWPEPGAPPTALHPETTDQSLTQPEAAVSPPARPLVLHSTARKPAPHRMRTATVPLPPERESSTPPERAPEPIPTPVVLPVPADRGADTAGEGAGTPVPAAPAVEVVLPETDLPGPLALPDSAPAVVPQVASIPAPSAAGSDPVESPDPEAGALPPPIVSSRDAVPPDVVDEGVRPPGPVGQSESHAGTPGGG